MLSKITVGIILFFVCAVLVYNFIMALNTTEADSIGEIATETMAKNPTLIFAVGVLVGHLWFN